MVDPLNPSDIRVNTIFNKTILNRIYTNAGRASTLGLELGTTLYPSEKWKINFGGNVFDYKIKGRLFGVEVNTSNITYSINASTNYDFSSTLRP